jgi:hypothetical protein
MSRPSDPEISRPLELSHLRSVVFKNRSSAKAGRTKANHKNMQKHAKTKPVVSYGIYDLVSVEPARKV